MTNPFDIWFGPGGLRGCFGAGVALGIQELIQCGDLSPEKMCIYGSSVGCLTGVYLATGNAHHGPAIYEEDVAQMICRRNLLPSIVQRASSGLARLRGSRRPLSLSRPVLNVDRVFDVMSRRTPDVQRQLQDTRSEILAEVFDVSRGQFAHIDLRTAKEPLRVIRSALNFRPFYCSPDNDLVDASIKGWGFRQVIGSRPPRKHVLVLNDPPLASRIQNFASDVLCAALAASPAISTCYLKRQFQRTKAVRSAGTDHDNVLIVYPNAPLRRCSASEFHRVQGLGRAAVDEIVTFLSVSRRR